MRVIRPAHLAASNPLRRLGPGVGALAGATVVTLLLVVVRPSPPLVAGVLGFAAALGLGIGGAWLWRELRADPERRLLLDVAALLDGAFDDDYTLILAPRLPMRGGGLAALLVGPAGVRAVTARDWDGRYRVRGRTWQFDAGPDQGWIACLTNPSFDLASVTERVSRWAEDSGMPNLPIGGVVAFPSTRSRIVLEEPADEIVTTDNVPWWANRIGRAQRLDRDAAVRFVAAVLDAGERVARKARGAAA